MANFPKGNFTITNNDTGRCLRARLGRTEDLSDHKEGMKYLLSKTDPPWLELGEPDGSIATAWDFDTAHDGSERVPFNQIVSVAVRDLQNIGNFCVWFDTGFATRDDQHEAWEAIAPAANARSATRKKYLTTLMPADWPESWKGDLRVWENCCWAYGWEGDVGFVRILRNNAKADGIAEWQGWGPMKDWTGDYGAAIKTAQAYIQEAAQDKVYFTRFSEGSTRLYGSGARREQGSTYRWTTDGTYIFGADSEKVPSEKTYWTDMHGHLECGPKGGPGQSWTIKAWTPAPSKVDGEAVLMTGLFGPLSLLGL